MYAVAAVLLFLGLFGTVFATVGMYFIIQTIAFLFFISTAVMYKSALYLCVVCLCFYFVLKFSPALLMNITYSDVMKIANHFYIFSLLVCCNK